MKNEIGQILPETPSLRGEHPVHIAGVGGSSPSSPTNNSAKISSRNTGRARATVPFLALMLFAGPAYADWIYGLDEAPDDVECWVDIDTYRVTYTYRSSHMPAVMPVEGMMCRLRDYEAQAEFFSTSTKHFQEYWQGMKK